MIKSAIISSNLIGQDIWPLEDQDTILIFNPTHRKKSLSVLFLNAKISNCGSIYAFYDQNRKKEHLKVVTNEKHGG